jgi:hypothetical protein
MEIRTDHGAAHSMPRVVRENVPVSGALYAMRSTNVSSKARRTANPTDP